MRTDAVIDKRQVHCKHSSWIGFSKGTAQVGDLILFRIPATGPNGEQTSVERIARMIGRVHYAPRLDGYGTPIRDFILAVMLGTELNHLAEFWINPDDVTRVLPIDRESRLATLASFLSDELVKAPIEEVRMCTSEGWSSLDVYREYQAKRTAGSVDYDKRTKA